jgi:predicted PhzF superfamily epimerase YddE/YHI9
MPTILHVVDAFTDRPFTGNPAAVCVLDRPADEAWMKNVAREMNLAETAFVHRIADGMDYLVEIGGAANLRALAPDFSAMSKLSARGVIVTSASDDPRFDFMSRFFAPAVGIDEDAVTGSSHCALGPWWQAKLGKTDFTARQCSARGGVVKLSVRGQRVLLRGQGVVVSRVELLH